MTQERFALARAGGGAILLDTISGAVLELNESATFVWERKLGGDPVQDIVKAHSARYSLPLTTAMRDVEQVLDPSWQAAAPTARDVQYERTADGYTFSFREQSVFHLDSTGRRLTLSSDIGEMSAPLLRAIAPKLLALQGEMILHASAVSLGEKVIAFTGASGAGKTTTARALTAAGGAIISEDMLWVGAEGAKVMVAENGERAIAAWVAETDRELRRSDQVDCSGFGATLRRGSLLPLAEIGFLDVRRRTREGGFAGKALRAWETAGLVFKNSFYGSAEPQSWVRGLERAAQIGTTSPGVELVLPDGLLRLEDEMRRIGDAGSLRW